MRKFVNALTILTIVIAANSSFVAPSFAANNDIWKGPVVVKWPNGKSYRCHKTASGQTSCVQI